MQCQENRRWLLVLAFKCRQDWWSNQAWIIYASFVYRGPPIKNGKCILSWKCSVFRQRCRHSQGETQLLLLRSLWEGYVCFCCHSASTTSALMGFFYECSCLCQHDQSLPFDCLLKSYNCNNATIIFCQFREKRSWSLAVCTWLASPATASTCLSVLTCWTGSVQMTDRGLSLSHCLIAALLHSAGLCSSSQRRERGKSGITSALR